MLQLQFLGGRGRSLEMGMMKFLGIADNSFAPTAECYGVFAQGTGFRER